MSQTEIKTDCFEKVIQHKDFKEDLGSLPCGSSTLLDLAIDRYQNNPSGRVYGTISGNGVKWMTNENFLSDVISLFLFIKKFLGRGRVVGLYSENRYEWVTAQHSIYMAGCKDCAIYPTANKDAILHIMNQTKMDVCFLSGEKASTLINHILPGQKPGLKHVVVFDDFPEKNKFEDLGIKVYLFSSILTGQEYSQSLIQSILDENSSLMMRGARYDDEPCTICYTSGTTGLPKGVVLTNKNFISILKGFEMTQDEFFLKIDESDVYLSYLTASHVLERVAELVVLYFKGSVVFYSGNIKNFANDLRVAEPTLLAAVPLVLSKMKEKIYEKLKEKNVIQRFLFDKALKYKIRRQSDGVYSSATFDYLIFKKIKESIGSKIRGVLVGGALVDPELVELFQAIFSCKIFIGYGATETTGLCCLTPTLTSVTDTVGLPFPTVKVKVVDEFDDKDKMSIFVRGSTVFKEYYENPKETQNSFVNGWYRTGDTGRFVGEKLQILGRNKDVFKNSKSEFVSSEKIENILRGSPIDDILVVGNSKVSSLGAIVVCTKETTKEEIMNQILKISGDRIAKKEMFQFEVPRRILLRHEPFSELGDVITATGKVKRGILEGLLHNEISELLSDDN